MRRGLLLLLLLLLFSGCRYTFWPLVPKETEAPTLVLVTASLKAENNHVLATIQVHRVPEPGYLEFRWYRGSTLLFSTSRFVEGPTTLTLDLPAADRGAYRLEAWWQDRRVEVALWSRPSPPRTAPPEWKEN